MKTVAGASISSATAAATAAPHEDLATAAPRRQMGRSDSPNAATGIAAPAAATAGDNGRAGRSTTQRRRREKKQRGQRDEERHEESGRARGDNPSREKRRPPRRNDRRTSRFLTSNGSTAMRCGFVAPLVFSVSISIGRSAKRRSCSSRRNGSRPRQPSPMCSCRSTRLPHGRFESLPWNTRRRSRPTRRSKAANVSA